MNVDGLPPIKNVWLVSGLEVYLISISQLCDQGLEVSFSKQKCSVKDHNLQTVLEGDRTSDNCYKIITNSRCCVVTEQDARIWHYKLGHINYRDLSQLSKSGAVRGIPTIPFVQNVVCGPCQQGKQHKGKHAKKKMQSTTEVLQLLHIDLFGPMQTESIGG